MSLRRAMLLVFAFLFTAGMTSVASAGCCGWGVQAPLVYTYASTGCGGCGTPTAAYVYAQPVAPAPPRVAWGWGTAWGGTWGAGWDGGWGAWGGGWGGCGCHRAYYYAATPAVELAPVAPAPIYVVNQGPDYSGPGLMVPYHFWSSGSYIVPGTYPYAPGYGYRHGYGYRYGWHPRFFAPHTYAGYRPRFYGHPFYHRPWYR